MSKITRKTAKVFGSSAGLNQIAEFGSLAASSPTFSTDPATIQSLSNWLTGWFGAVIGANSPAIEDMNAFCYVMAYQVAYLLQQGIGEYDSGTTYYKGSFVSDDLGNTYYSLIDTNLNNTPSSSPSDWQHYGISYWNSTVTYNTGDFIFYNNNIYYSLSNSNTGNTPSSSPASWQPFLTSQYHTPTVQKLISTGTTAGYLFTVTSANATVGATYTNNGNTYTVLSTISASTTLYCSNASGPTSSGTLTKASGTGDSTITFSANVPLAVYTTPANVLYLKLRGVGGGGGGAATASGAGTAGGATTFGAGIIFAGGGGGGLAAGAGPSTGGTGSVNSPALDMGSFAGGSGSSGCGGGGTINPAGAGGASSPFGGAGGGGGGSGGSAAATAAIANTGSGGGGGGAQGGGVATTGGGGASGYYFSAFLPTPAASYYYCIGAAGTGGTASGIAGANGAKGVIIVEEYYQ